MASKRKLRGSFNSLSDTLAFRSDPSFPEQLSGRWLSVMTHAAEIGRRQGHWTNLPSESEAFDPVLADLVDATNELALADDAASRLTALDGADRALDKLASLLAQAGDV